MTSVVREGRLAAEALEPAPQLTEELRQAPRQQAVSFERGAAEFLERRIVLARQLGERRLAVFGHAEVEEVVRVLRPAGHAPGVGIDDPHHDLVAMLDEERLQLRREQIDRPRHDQPVPDEAPRERRSGQQHQHDEHGGKPNGTRIDLY